MKEFNVAFHLVGDQTIPVFIGIMAINAEKQVLLATEKTMLAAKRIKAEAECSGKKNIFLEEIAHHLDFNILATDYKRIVHKYLNDADNAAFNITGGTKPMSITANSLDRYAGNLNILPFYLVTQNKEIVWLAKDIYSTTFDFSMKIENFINLAGLEIVKNTSSKIEKIMDRYTLAELIWKNQNQLFKNTEQFRKFLQEIQKKSSKPNKKFLELIAVLEKNIEHITPLKKEFKRIYNSLKPHHFAEFIIGKWFEEYCFGKLYNSARIAENSEILPGIEIKNETSTIQELDISYTDGINLTVIECKYDYMVPQDNVHKLFSITDSFGGVMGRGALVSSLKPKKIILSRFKNHRSLSCFYGDKGIKSLLENFPKISAGKIFGKKE